MARWTKSKTISGFYNDYLYRKNKEHPYYVDSKTYRNIIKDFFTEIQDYLIDGNTYKAPFGMGEFYIKRIKCQGFIRDYNTEKKIFKEENKWKSLYLQNFHTSGYLIRIKWNNFDKHTIPNHKMVNFYPNRRFKNKLSKQLKTTGDISKYLGESIKLTKNKILI